MPHEFEAQDAELRQTGFPALVRANGTNFPVSGYSFDAATEEAIYFSFIVTDYTSGDVIVDLYWYAATATSGVVVWGAQIAAITPNVDTTNVETDAFPTVTSVSDTHLGTTAKRIHHIAITLTGSALDSLAEGDRVCMRISRVAASGSDTMAGDAVLTNVVTSA